MCRAAYLPGCSRCCGSASALTPLHGPLLQICTRYRFVSLILALLSSSCVDVRKDCMHMDCMCLAMQSNITVHHEPMLSQCRLICCRKRHLLQIARNCPAWDLSDAICCAAVPGTAETGLCAASCSTGSAKAAGGLCAAGEPCAAGAPCAAATHQCHRCTGQECPWQAMYSAIVVHLAVTTAYAKQPAVAWLLSVARQSNFGGDVASMSGMLHAQEQLFSTHTHVQLLST